MGRLACRDDRRGEGLGRLLIGCAVQRCLLARQQVAAFALISLVFGSRYLVSRRTTDVALAGGALFVGATSNSLVIPLLVVGYSVLIVVGLITRAWTKQTLGRMVAVGILAVVAANLYIPLGLARGIPLNRTFDLYSPVGSQTFDARTDEGPSLATKALSNNALFQLGTVAAAVGVVVGFALLVRARDQGRILLTMSGTALAVLLAYDTLVWRAGLLFRVRQGWITAELLAIGLGMGLGAIVLLLSSFIEAHPKQERESQRWAPPRGALEGLALVVAALVFSTLWPRYSAAARTVGPSGFPQATEVALNLINAADPLTFTFVGVSEQYQEALDKGFFTEAWVFARDITFAEAKDPAYELTIPTDNVYIFAEKVAFGGPQAPRAYGPTQEFYRDQTRRGRMMRRIMLWSQAYEASHKNIDIVYEDAVLRVYKIRRKVDTVRADLSPAFKDYTWRPGEYFDDDGDITANVVTANPNPDPTAR